MGEASEWAGLDPISLVELRAPLRPMRFPNGRVIAVVPFDAAAFRLAREVDAGNRAAALALVRRCVPDATADDLNTLVREDYQHIVAHARSPLDAVLDEMDRRRGQSPGKVPVAPIGLTALRGSSRPSRRATIRAWWSRVWRRRAAGTSGPSTPHPTT